MLLFTPGWSLEGEMAMTRKETCRKKGEKLDYLSGDEKINEEKGRLSGIRQIITTAH